MLLACDPSGARIEASPGARARCPSCDLAVLAKCGALVCWHWAHETGRECDPWAEHETPWHVQWKRRFPTAWQERVIGPHRADVLTGCGTVIEFQHSGISAAEVYERETFYGRMIWVFDAQLAAAAGRVSVRPRLDYVTFRWRHARRTVTTARCPIWLDLGTRLLEVRRLHTDPFAGWGQLHTPDAFVAQYGPGLRAPGD